MPTMRLSVPLADDDFAELASFSLSWRWTDRKWNLLPDTALAGIRPLADAAARQAWTTLKSLFHPNDWNLDPQHFGPLQEVDTSGDAEPVRAWLEHVIPPHSDDVLIQWEPGLAALTHEAVFRTYWDDFCYPSSDDVLIWPLSDAWAAFYFHEESLTAGIRRH